MRKNTGLFLMGVLISLFLFSSCASMMQVNLDHSNIEYWKSLEKENPKEFVKGPLRYILIDKERKEWKKEIKKMAKEYQIPIPELQNLFVDYIWAKRNTSTNSEENDFRDMFYRNLSYVESRFRSPGRGWNGDRGEIYMTLGKPDTSSSISTNWGAYEQLTNELPDVADALGINHDPTTEAMEWTYNNLDYDVAVYGLELVYPASIYFRNGRGGWELAIKIEAWQAGRYWGVYEDLYIPAKRCRFFSSFTELQKALERVRETYIYDEELTFKQYFLEKSGRIKWVPVEKEKENK